MKSFNSLDFVLNVNVGWQIQGITYSVTNIDECLSFKYLVSNRYHLVKFFELDYHYSISFELKLLIFKLQSKNIHIYIDDVLVNTINNVNQKLKFAVDLCNSISMQEINIVQYQHLKTQLKIEIKVEFYDNTNIINPYIGIRDFQLFLRKRSFDDGCFDKNIDPFDGCFSNNYDCIQGCGICIKGICYGCLVGWEFDQQTQICIPYCGDAIITFNEECDDGNQNPYDGCHECKYSCNNNCKKCEFGKCLECENQHILLEGNCYEICSDQDNMKFKENVGCFDFIKSEGYQYRLKMRIKYKISFLIIQIQMGVFQIVILQVSEYLDINITNVNLNQLYGKCLECLDGYEFDFHKNQCIHKCLDEIILYQEICDDGVQSDGCYICQKSCQIECLFCFYDKCYLCQEGWQLQDYSCKQICGDGQLAILSNEQCDDLEDAYCVNCKYQCNPDCEICDKFQNCEIYGKCLPICGDNIVTPVLEQCDDGNDIPYDGCYKCEFQCSFGCIKCEKDNHCLQCLESNFYLDTYSIQCKELQSQIEPKQEDDKNMYIYCSKNKALINDECINLCGNGMLDSHFEQCDDGNNNGGDGCSSLCNEEDSYICINQENQLTQCSFIQQPNFNLLLLSDRQNQTKIIDLKFTQEVYLQSGLIFEQIVEFVILPNTRYGLSIVPINNITFQLNNPHYQITVQFDSPVTDPILQINIQQNSILNQYDIDLYTNSKEINLGTPFVLSTVTQERVIQIIKLNDAFVYSSASIAGILLLTGNYIVFVNLLDLLQTLSYIRFMQYKFPPHLMQFLETYTKISLKPILDNLKIDEFIARMNGGTLPNLQKKSSQSTQTNVLNQFYIINAKGCYLSYILSMLTYILCCLITSNQVSAWVVRCLKNNEENLKILRLLSIFQKKIQQTCYNIKKHYFTFGVFQVFYSTLHQQLFSTLLQFPYYNFDSPFEVINSIAALVSLIFLFQIFFKLLSITTSQIKDKQKWKYFFQDSKTEYWAANFKSFQIYRTALYIIIITKFMKYPEAQSVLLSMQSLFYSIYLIHFRPIKSKFELAKLICREVTLLINTGSFLLYSFKLNDVQYLLFGWLHISLFCFLMGFTLIVDLLESGQKAYYIHLKKIQAIERMNIQRYYDNPLQKFVEMNNLDMKK
ncbi:unnamed protein product [Paramecium pentaurelia]|uniref:Transmembrane protein n=1 Tax=Paramecium pentaurelia TaxID=43138 RepID=A0A8S1XCY8_9CILI|nr:unnamed protein product [Paramecium pentaurelia]